MSENKEKKTITFNGEEYVIDEKGEAIIDSIVQAMVLSQHIWDNHNEEFTHRLNSKLDLIELVIEVGYMQEKLRRLDEIRKAIVNSKNEELAKVLEFLG